MLTVTTNSPFPDDTGDRHVMRGDDGEVVATWYEPHPEVRDRMRRVVARRAAGERVGGVFTGGGSPRLTAILVLLGFLTGLLF